MIDSVNDLTADSSYHKSALHAKIASPGKKACEAGEIEMTAHDKKDEYYDSDRDPKVWIVRTIALIVGLLIFFFIFVYPHTRMKQEMIEEKYSYHEDNIIRTVDPDANLAQSARPKRM